MYPQRVGRLPGLAMLGLQQVGIYPSAKGSDSDSDSDSSYSYTAGSRYNSNPSSFGNGSNPRVPRPERASHNANPRGNLPPGIMPLNSGVPFPMIMPPPRPQPDLDRNGNIIRYPRQASRDSDMSDSGESSSSRLFLESHRYHLPS